MPRMFDILKNRSGGGSAGSWDAKHPREGLSVPAAKDEKRDTRPIAFSKAILKAETKEEKKQENHPLVSKKLISVVKEHGVDNQGKAEEIYESAIHTVETLLDKVRRNENIAQYTDKLNELLNNLFNRLIMGDNILNSVYEERAGAYFLPYHIVNVLILSSVLGLAAGFNKSRLSHLGLASIFYDIGMDSFKNIIEQPRKLESGEMEVVKGHVAKSLEILERAGNINGIVKETVMMHHERALGDGYPAGISSGDINPYAKILGLVDTYEAMTHARPYRDGMNTHNAVKELVGSMRDEFDLDVIKIFVNKMSVYPIGSIIRLETGEIVRVISVKAGSPLRPVVMVLIDADGDNVKERVVIDLSEPNTPLIID